MKKTGFPVHSWRAAPLAFALACTLGGCSSNTPPAAASDTPHDVTLTTAQQASIRLYTVVPSTYRTVTNTPAVVDDDPDHATAVLAPFSGPVSQVLVNLGDRVQKGQPLARVNSPDFAAAVQAYRKTLAAAVAATKLAATDRDLYAHDALSQKENMQAQSDAAGAVADRDAARAALVAMQADPKTLADIEQGRVATVPQAVIRAPLAGTITERAISPGQLLAAGSTPCFTVADTTKAWVLAPVFSADLPHVKAGDRAVVDLGNHATLAGTVTNVSPEVNPDTLAATARVVVDDPHAALKRHMAVNVRIESAVPQQGLLVPVGAVLRNDENLPFVYVKNAGGGYARRAITLGERTGDRYLITNGLHAGDRIVAEGGIFVRFIQTQ